MYLTRDVYITQCYQEITSLIAFGHPAIQSQELLFSFKGNRKPGSVDLVI